MNKHRKKKRITIVIGSVITVIVLTFVSYLMFMSNVEINVDEKGVVAKATLVTTSEVDCRDVDSVALIKNLDVGKRTEGFGNFSVKAGHFKNKIS